MRCLQAVLAFSTGALGGAAIGFAVSLLVNTSLLEISTNSLFAVLFGVALILMGALIACRVRHKKVDEDSSHFSKYFVLAFALLVIVAGVFCFLVDVHWFHINQDAKVPMYAFLGIALWFAFVFMILDVVNYLYQCGVARMKDNNTRVLSSQAFVSTPTQIWLVLVMTTGLGVYFGLIFGLFDVAGDPAKRHREIYYTTPIGTLVCSLFGIMNQFYLWSLSSKSDPSKYFKVYQDDDDGI